MVQSAPASPAPERINVLVFSFLSLCLIALGLWLVSAGKTYRELYVQGTGDWFVGSQRAVELTLVREDKSDLGCPSDHEIAGLRCAYGRDGRLLQATPPENPLVLQPYNTVDNVLLLGAGLWRWPELQAALPDQRFTAACKYDIKGLTRSAAIRFAANAAFTPLGKSVPVGTLTGLRNRAMTGACPHTGPRSVIDLTWRVIAMRIPKFSHPATGWLLVLMVVVGVVLRIQNVGYPLRFGFDEEQMVSAARQFLAGEPDTGECCHPPLSKVLISASILIFGDNPVGWRFPSLWLGLQSILLVFLLARALFNDARAGWLAAACLAADGFPLAFSRVAFPEGMMTCFVLWTMLAAVTARGWAGVLTCAVLVGLSGSIKWSGFQVGLPACLAILMLRRVPWYSICAFAIAPPSCIWGIWMIGLSLMGHPIDPMSVWDEIQTRKERHLGFVRFSNPLESSWYTWLYLYHPLVVKAAHLGTKVRLASSVANPVVFFASDLGLLSVPVVGLTIAASRRWRAHWRRWTEPGFDKALAITALSWLSLMLLWFSGRISSYWYHYLTPYGFALVLLAGILARLDRDAGKLVLGFVVLVLLALIYFAPVWAELPISISGAHRRLIFPHWR